MTISHRSFSRAHGRGSRPLTAVPAVFVGAIASAMLAACSDQRIGDEHSIDAGTAIFVDAAASGSDTGGSWSSAHHDLQAAIDHARPGDEIWVKGGTYRPARGAGHREASFRLKSGVAIYGGFLGFETRRDDRDFIHNVTILSGDLAGDDGPSFAHNDENCYQVVTAVDTDHHTVLDGFRITGGNADGPGFGATPESRDQGSGINVYFGGPRLANLTVVGNWNLNHGAVNDHGHETRVESSSFRDNVARGFGAGLYLHHEAATVVEDCTFFDNTTPGDGGGAYTRSEHGASFTRCTFVGNHAGRGAGMYFAEASRTEIVDCTFSANVGELGGGGFYSDVADTDVVRSRFDGNRAGIGVQGGGAGAGGSGGGGAWTNGGRPSFVDCRFEDNEASLGGGLYHKDMSLATVARCTFVANRATEAGGLYTLNSDVIVRDCVFVANSATGTDFSVGGAISNYYSNAIVESSTFVENHCELGGGGIYNEGEFPRVSRSTFFHNTALGTTEGWGGGIMNGYFTTPTIDGCSFVANVARQGGGVFDLVFSHAIVTNCTFTENAAVEGGAVYSYHSSDPTFANCIFWGDQPDELVGAVNVVVSSCIQGGHAGDRNLALDPRFLRAPHAGLDGKWGSDDDDAGDLRLDAGSPCVDAGDNTLVPRSAVLDLAGKPRFADDPFAPDTGIGTPPFVDFGAYER